MKKITKIFILIVIFLSFYYIETIIMKDNTLINKIVFKEISNSKKNNIIFKEIQTIITNKDTSNLVSLLNYNSEDYVFEKEIDIENIEDKKPFIYIYNTHDKEEYSSVGLENYNINADVKTASYILQEQLKKYNITSLVEERSPTDMIKKDNLDYPSTYTYSKQYALEIKDKYPTINYFVDLHRDGVSKETSTVVIDDTSYAKLMFVVGMEHENSNQNYQLVKKLESYINEKYPGILRNTHVRQDDHFNQDIDNNAFLIEVGGNYNTIDEVYNSLVIFAEALSYLMSGVL